jgi:site-specific DNA-methyltransferase (cytosine-N4-specific)
VQENTGNTGTPRSDVDSACKITPWLDDGDVQLYHGDVRTQLDRLPPGIARTCVTSPPYWGLRDYGVEGQIGLEPTLVQFIDGMVDVFRSVRRVLADDGTLWVNMGDSYAGGGCGARDPEKWPKQSRNDHMPTHAKRTPGYGLKHKDLCGQPWRLALQEGGWYLRRDIVWHKPNAMPESASDRPHTAHEYLFLLTKSPRYHYNGDAIRSPLAPKTLTTFGTHRRQHGTDALGQVRADNWARDVSERKPRLGADGEPVGAATRSVWSIPAGSFRGAHFATFPADLVEPCILAGSEPGDVVLDPFVGSGTTAAVARLHGRRAIGTELNEDYLRLAADRLSQQSLLTPEAS